MKEKVKNKTGGIKMKKLALLGVVVLAVSLCSFQARGMSIGQREIVSDTKVMSPIAVSSDYENNNDSNPLILDDGDKNCYKVEVTFDNPDDYIVSHYKDAPPIWVSKNTYSLSFSQWDRGENHQKEVQTQFENGTMRLDYNTSAGGFFTIVQANVDIGGGEVGRINGQVSGSMLLKRPLGSEGRLVLELKSEDLNGQSKIKEVDVTDQVPADGKWHQVEITTPVDIHTDTTGGALSPQYTGIPCFTLAVDILSDTVPTDEAFASTDEKTFVSGKLYIDNVSIAQYINYEKE